MATSKRDALLALIDDASDDDDLELIAQALAQMERDAIGHRKTTRADKMREASSRAQKRATRDSQDIGEPPIGLEDLQRKRRSQISLRYFLQAHFPNLFFRGFSKDHKRIIRLVQDIIEHGGQKAVCLKRKAGKSTILICAVLWSVLTGRRRYVCLISASSKTAKKLLSKIKKTVRTNVTLQADYAASLHCLVSLGGRSNAANGQHVDGRSTNVQWSPEFIASGYIDGHHEIEWCISSLSILSEDIRGQSFVTQNGEAIRVGQILVDDPQSRATAKSKAKVKRRLEIINGDVLSCGGENQVAAFAALTIIEKNDVADILVDRKKSKAWTGEKVPCVKVFPDNIDLWNEWEEIYLDELDLDEVKHSRSRQFVQSNLDEMHAGSVMFWDQDYDRSSEVSALHGAMIKRAKDRKSFASEQQLDPINERVADNQLYDLDAEEIAVRTTFAKRLEVPEGVEVITAFVDVQTDFLPYMVVGWTLPGRGYILDYGSFPDQGVPYYTKSTLQKTFKDVYGDRSFGDLVSEGLEDLVGALMGQEFLGGDSVHSIDKLGIDVGFKLAANEVRSFCRESIYRGRVHPQQGKAIGANSQHWQRFGSGKSRRKKGINCAFVDPPNKQRGVKELNVDVNAYKCQMAEALSIPASSRNAVLLFDDLPENHLMFGEHWADAESPWLETGKDGSQSVVWKPNQTGIVENDHLDCLVGCAAIASTLGVFDRSQQKANARSSVDRVDLTGFYSRMNSMRP